MDNLKVSVKTFIRYLLLIFSGIVTFPLLINIYVHQTGKLAREFCDQVSIGMKIEKIQLLATEKGLDEKRNILDSHDSKYTFLAGPNRESKCVVVVREGCVINKNYVQYL